MLERNLLIQISTQTQILVVKPEAGTVGCSALWVARACQRICVLLVATQ